MKMEHLFVSRVLAEDDEFVTLEVGKTDAVVWHLQRDETGEVVGGDRFLTLVFVHSDGKGGMEVWSPFEDKA